MTLAVFHAEGKRPVRNDRLKIRHKGYAIEGARDFNTRLVMPSGPGALSDGSFRM